MFFQSINCKSGLSLYNLYCRLSVTSKTFNSVSCCCIMSRFFFVDGTVWKSLFSTFNKLSFCEIVALHYLQQPELWMPGSTVAGEIFEPNFLIIIFNLLLRCSMCRSTGIFFPVRPLVFTVLFHLRSHTSLGDKSIDCAKNKNPSLA